MPIQSRRRFSVASRSVAAALVVGLSTWVSLGVAAESTAPTPIPTAASSHAGVNEANGKISLIDTANSLIVVTLRNGRTLSFDATNYPNLLGRVHLGDKVAIRYLEPSITQLAPAQDAALTQLDSKIAVTRDKQDGGDLAFKATRTSSGVVEVTAVNRKLAMLTIVDTSGAPHSIKVTGQDALGAMESLKRHDHIRIASESALEVKLSKLHE